MSVEGVWVNRETVVCLLLFMGRDWQERAGMCLKSCLN